MAVKAHFIPGKYTPYRLFPANGLYLQFRNIKILFIFYFLYIEMYYQWIFDNSP